MFRWRLEIADFEALGGKLKFEYKKGAEHKVADALSWNPVDPPELHTTHEDRWVAAQATLKADDFPELTRHEEERWVAAHVLVDRQAVSEARDQKAAKATPTGKEKVEDDPGGLAQGAAEE